MPRFEDELSHSGLSQAVYAAVGRREPARLVREHLTLQQAADEPLELALARVNLEVFCLGETVAVRLFARLCEGCTEPVADCSRSHPAR